MIIKLFSYLFLFIFLFSLELLAKGRGAIPVIHITDPANGWTAMKVVQVKGYVENHEGLREIKFIFNGISRFIPLSSGRFSQKIVLGAGANYVKLEAKNSQGIGVNGIKLVTNNSQMDLKVILSWDTNHTDVDLWVTDPTGERVYYAHPRSKINGNLDIDITTGYGPETFTLPVALPGEYIVQVQYYGGSRPTMAKVNVILYQGTAKEKKYIFPALLLRRGKGINVGRFKVE